MKSEIIKLEEELRLAMVNSDVDKLDELIDDSLIFTTPDGKIATKQMDLEVHRSQVQKISELVPSEQIVKIYENCAVVTVKMKLIGDYNGINISGLYRYTRLWAKIDDKWKIVAGSVVQIPCEIAY